MDVIVIQTVQEEVKNKSLPLYHRLIALTQNDGKRFIVFFNEFSSKAHRMSPEQPQHALIIYAHWMHI
jgi:hypothetical protein